MSNVRVYVHHSEKFYVEQCVQPNNASRVWEDKCCMNHECCMIVSIPTRLSGCFCNI